MRQEQSVTERIHKVKYIFYSMYVTSLTEFQLEKTGVDSTYSNVEQY
jgi:hypothetical protein